MLIGNQIVIFVLISFMNDTEVQALTADHYRNESHTLTANTEANLLKLRELLKILTPEETTRWEEIKRTFACNLLNHGGDDKDGSYCALLRRNVDRISPPRR